MGIKVGISTCLLGENVRYDGGHKLDHYLKETLGQYVDWVPVCPEVECGLPVPREAMRLVRTSQGIRLMTQRTHRDQTSRMEKWIRRELKVLDQAELCGFVFKSKSPSSGMQRVKIYEKGKVVQQGEGLFAKAFMARFPYLPVEDSGRLQDPVLRENFITRIFVFDRWRHYVAHDRSANGLQQFHGRHKLLIMSRSPAMVAPLGRMAASANGTKAVAENVLNDYCTILLQALGKQTTVKKNTNVLHHLLGYFKKKINADAKAEAVGVIENYYRGLVPLIVPITLIQHHLRMHPDEYLANQYYLNPHPLSLMLYNHVPASSGQAKKA